VLLSHAIDLTGLVSVLFS